MFFILSKLLINFIYPFAWVLLLLLLALVLKNPKAKKRCSITGLSILLFFSTPFFLTVFARMWDIDKQAANKEYSCAIILGGFVSADQNERGYFNGASDRFIQAVAMKNSGKAKHLLFSGGNADLRPGDFREMHWLSKQMGLFNIPDSCILIEKNARNTFENVKYGKQILNEKNLKPPYLLITSAFHMRRSLLTFKKLGLQVEPHSCNYIAGKEELKLRSFIPSVDALYTWNAYIKEVVGYVVYSLKI
jgi:uncharacterized SAM-binding protein YcdF (DUF218 family)